MGGSAALGEVPAEKSLKGLIFHDAWAAKGREREFASANRPVALAISRHGGALAECRAECRGAIQMN
jgi:hypothetical protein